MRISLSKRKEKTAELYFFIKREFEATSGVYRPEILNRASMKFSPYGLRKDTLLKVLDMSSTEWVEMMIEINAKKCSYYLERRKERLKKEMQELNTGKTEEKLVSHEEFQKFYDNVMISLGTIFELLLHNVEQENLDFMKEFCSGINSRLLVETIKTKMHGTQNK